MNTVVRNIVAGLFVALVAVVAGCAIDATDVIAGSGPSGSLGSECKCGNGQADCDGAQGQCQPGLSCVKGDNDKQVCTQGCPCPLNYICKAARVPGARLSCFKQP
jgi:hypothetical protein